MTNGTSTHGSRSCAGPELALREQAELGGPGRGGVAVRRAELGEHGGDVVVDGLGRDEQLRRYRRVGLPGTDLREDLALAPGEPERIATGRGPGAGRDGPCAERAQPLPGEPGRGGRADLGEGAQRLPQC